MKEDYFAYKLFLGADYCKRKEKKTKQTLRDVETMAWVSF